MEEPNNRWYICEDCGVEYYDISYKKQCDLCINKHNYHKNVLFDEKRNKIIERLYIYSSNRDVQIDQIECDLIPKVKNESSKWSNINENKVSLDMWLDNNNVGNNLCYNIWDKVVEEYLNKNYFTKISDL